jgi:hypothetical protein
MLRHKAMIQCARLAFSFVGIYDQDEAERIVEHDMGQAEVIEEEKASYPDDQFEANFPAWEKLISTGKRTADQIIAMVASKAPLTDEQKTQIRSVGEVIAA